MLHRFSFHIDMGELPEQFTYPFYYKPHPLVEHVACEMISMYHPILKSMGQGKMMGVLIVLDKNNQIGYIAAYSGELNDQYNYCVNPIVDYLSPNGYFKSHENEITAINHQINDIKSSESYLKLKQQIDYTKQHNDKQLAQAKANIKINKQLRDRQRADNKLSLDVKAELIRESQHEKAELKRLQQRLEVELTNLSAQLQPYETQLQYLSKKRRELSAALQDWLFDQYTLLNANGQTKRLDDIFREFSNSTPPSAAGDCCAPRLLQYAYQHQLKPIAMGEFWVGPTPENSLRREGVFYPSCQRKCKPILSFMLQGLNVAPNPLQMHSTKGVEIIYEDQWLIAVNKPGGIPSVPGLTSDDSVVYRIQATHPDDKIEATHRLDMATSGILILAKNKEILAAMHTQFENRDVKKKYVALLEHRPLHDSGVVNLPIGYDIDDTCRRMVDYEHGKVATTHYRMVGQLLDYPLVEFLPETGRTHQLRIHSAHKNGLNAPIVGDNLYGHYGEVMYLCSYSIQFRHPVTTENIKLELSKDEWFK